MLDGIDGSFCSRAHSKLSTVACAAAPDHHEPIELVISRELPDVGDDLLGQVPLVLSLLHVRPVEALDVPLIEDRRPRPDLLELGPDAVEQRRLDDARRASRGVAVVLEDVPAAEHQIIEP
jgi:hypothetical protein